MVEINKTVKSLIQDKILEELKSLRANADKDTKETLEANTDDYLVRPLIESLGYPRSASLPNRFQGQFPVGGKKDKKVDLALFKDNKLSILVEIKRLDIKTQVLLSRGKNQLSEYVSLANDKDIKFALLTNGVQYFVYECEGSHMDNSYCFEFNIEEDINNEVKLSKFIKLISNCDSETAKKESLKTRTKAFIENYVITETKKDISEDILDQVIRIAKGNKIILHEGEKISPKDRDNLRPVLHNVFQEIIDEKINARIDRLKNPQGDSDTENEDEDKPKYNFTPSEEKGLSIIRAIASQIEGLDVENINHNDNTLYCPIIYWDKDSNIGGKRNGLICNLHFDEDKDNYSVEFKYTGENQSFDLNSPSDLYKYADSIIGAIKSIDGLSV